MIRAAKLHKIGTPKHDVVRYHSGDWNGNALQNVEILLISGLLYCQIMPVIVILNYND
jgi:hypothetical protein